MLVSILKLSFFSLCACFRLLKALSWTLEKIRCTLDANGRCSPRGLSILLFKLERSNMGVWALYGTESMLSLSSPRTLCWREKHIFSLHYDGVARKIVTRQAKKNTVHYLKFMYKFILMYASRAIHSWMAMIMIDWPDTYSGRCFYSAIFTQFRFSRTNINLNKLREFQVIDIFLFTLIVWAVFLGALLSACKI